MAFCSNCGNQLADNAKFCFECGAKIGTKTVHEETQRKTVYDGEIHKCPNCGDILDAYESVCESCGYERRGVKAVSSVRELARKLQEIEEQRPVLSVHQKQMEANARILPKTDQRKIELIKNFPIPNTKEDMYEFLVLAVSNIDVRTYSLGGGSYIQKSISNAWYAKLEQAYTKAKFAFGKHSDFEEISTIYQKKHEEIAITKQKKVRSILAIIFGAASFVIVLVGMILILTLPVAKEKREKISQEAVRLEAVVQEVYNAIEDENYVLARAKAANVVYGGPTEQGGYQVKEKWESVRTELLEIIEQAERGLEYTDGSSENTE